MDKMKGTQQSEAQQASKAKHGKTERAKFHIGSRGGFSVDPVEFFAQEGVQDQLKELRKLQPGIKKAIEERGGLKLK